MELIGFILIGLFAGIAAGFLGIGGGIVTIPCLLFIFHHLQMPSSILMRLTIGTSLAAMVFNTLSSFISHYRKKGVIFSIVRPMSLGVIFGTFIGAFIAKHLSSAFLKVFFGIFECYLGLHFFFPDKKRKKIHPMPSFFTLSGMAFGVSTFSTMLGIGGGLINVPILMRYGISLKKAVGTSSALSFLITLMGALFFVVIGKQETMISYTFGFIYLPAFFIISFVSFISAPLGAKLTHLLPPDISKRVFGFILMLAGLNMIFS